ncbi:hypothetical protein EsH8_III_001463 [Colletotrichum jinshuiense]
MSTNPLNNPSMAAAMADLDQIEICQLKTKVLLQEQQIAQLRSARDSARAEVKTLRALEDVDQTQIVQLQARVEQLEAQIAARESAIRGLKRGCAQQREQARRIHTLQEENQILRDRNARLEETVLMPGAEQRERGRQAQGPLLLGGVANPAGLFSHDDEGVTLDFGDLDNADAVGNVQYSASDSGFEGYVSEDASNLA